MKRQCFLLVLCMGLGILNSANVLAEPASAQSIRQLMQVSDVGQMPASMVEQMRPALEQVIPAASDTFWDLFLGDVDLLAIEQRMISVYQKHLSEEDVKNMIEFYSTPTGRKIIKSQSAIAQESMEIGQAWGRTLAEQAIEKYENGEYSQ